MAKKILFVTLILAGLVFSGAKMCFADAAELLEQAKTYANNGYWPTAKQIYRAIVTDYPATDYALRAEGELICMSTREKTNEQIQADCQLCRIFGSVGKALRYSRQLWMGK